jgi:hypothetical protein
MQPKYFYLKTCVFAWMMVTVHLAQAGRPLAVDDANVNDKGAGHVEAWVARDISKSRLLNIAPAYAPLDGLEISGVLSRDTTNRVNAQALQAKWRITPSRQDGCNVATVLGGARVSGGEGNATYLSANLSCNGLGPVNMHANLGVNKAQGASATSTWGLAAELPMASWTPHVEVFGAEGAKTTAQFGARTQVTKTLQLDGNVSRHNALTAYSIGVKYQF